MASDVPAEIWDLICDQVDRHPTQASSSIKTLHSLSLVSTASAGVAQRHVFRRYDFGEGRNNGKKHVKFLRSILDRPALATCVKEVILEHWIHIRDDDENEELNQTYSRIGQRLGFDPAELFPVTLQESKAHIARDLPSIIYAFLPLLPSLEKLQVRTRHEEDAFQNLTRWHDAGLIRRFENLKTLILEHGDTEMGFSLMINEPILRLAPNVTVLRLFQTDGIFWRGSGTSTPEALTSLNEAMPPGLVTLDLANSNLEADDMRTLIKACPGIQHFRYESGGASTSESNEEATFADITRALLPASTTLRTVDINTMQSIADDDSDDEPDEDFFKKFEVLEHVVFDGSTIFSRKKPSSSERQA